MMNFLHILWRIPSEPSRASDPSLQAKLFEWLSEIGGANFEILDFFYEGSRLEALLEVENIDELDQRIETVNRRLKGLIRSQPPQAPLYFQTRDLKNMRASERRVRPPYCDQIFKQKRKYTIEPKRYGEFSQFIIRHGNHIQWPTRRVVSIW